MPFPSAVRVPESSRIEDVSALAARNARASLHYFMTAVLHVSCPENVSLALQGLVSLRAVTAVIAMPAYQARAIGPAFLLWLSLQGDMRRTFPSSILRSRNDAFTWLFGASDTRICDSPNCTWSADAEGLHLRISK
jgi:hypothetical protein